MLRMGWFALFLIAASPLVGVAKPYGNPYAFRDAIEDMKYEFQNHEKEIRVLEEKMQRQEETISSLREMIRRSNQSAQNVAKGSADNHESRLAEVESTIRNIEKDLHKFQEFASEATKAQVTSRDRLSSLEKKLENMQVATEALVKALDVNIAIPDSNYRVQRGDTLGGIAQRFHTSVSALKQRNKLRSNKIVVGQVLEIPSTES